MIKGKAEYLGGTRFRFVWPCGHAQSKDLGKGPIAKRIGEDAARFFARYWRDGVYLHPCRKCKKP